ncbi:MAG: DUF4296 domain-containing protein [Flavobacteriaceae bacterium]|nr:DUF4296 domain-containing protein [Flavobacteriaceae bacterium]
MRKIITAVLISLLVLHCKNNRIDMPEKPDNLISEEKMVEVLFDMTVISAAKGLNRRVMEDKGIEPETFVYEKHQIDSVQFSESNRYYSYDVKTYELIYARVKEKLQAQKELFNKDLKAKATKADSISKTNRVRRDSLIRLKTPEINPDLQ